MHVLKKVGKGIWDHKDMIFQQLQEIGGWEGVLLAPSKLVSNGPMKFIKRDYILGLTKASKFFRKLPADNQIANAMRLRLQAEIARVRLIPGRLVIPFDDLD